MFPYINLDFYQKRYSVFHATIPLKIELEVNVCKTYGRSNCKLKCEGASKLENSK